MPPLTPRPTSAMANRGTGNRGSGNGNDQTPRLLGDPGLPLDLLDGARQHFLLRHRRLLVQADLDARHRAGEQLSRASASRDDEFEAVGDLGLFAHANVLTIRSASGRMRPRRARSAMTMLRSRSTAAVSSSLTTTYSYSVNDATSSRATCSRRWIAASASLLRPRSRCSRMANDGGITNTVVVAIPRCRTFRAPCTSMTRTTSHPSRRGVSVSDAQVPYRFPNTSAHSRKSPAAIIVLKRARLTKL